MTASVDQLVMFPLLAEPASYRANTIDLLADAEARERWLTIFEQHVPSLARHCVRSEGDTDEARVRAERFARRFGAELAALRDDPGRYGRLDILLICRMRAKYLRDLGFADPYAPVKADENATALALLGDVLGELDRISDARRLAALIVGVFAGNKFDLGATATNTDFDAGGFSFHGARASISPRPWLMDDLDALAARWSGAAHRKAVVFVDNAGADLTLGMIPLIRELLRRGTEVVAAANTHPALNDVTHAELGEHLEAVGALDRVIADALADRRLVCAASGNDAPLIDLSQVSAELAAAATDADLLILEGMGRAIETNLHARFTCDCLKLAMIKERHLSDMLGGKLFDCVCRFEPAPGRS
jgi:type II pantothenate kinase